MISGNLSSVPEDNPYELIRIRDSVYAADLLFAAIGHFDFFTQLKGKELPLPGICELFQIKERPADVLLTYCKALGLISENSNAEYTVTKKAEEYLTSGSNMSLVPYFKTQLERPIAQKMVNVLVSNEPQSWGGKKDEQDWAKAMEREDFAETFTSGMDSRGVCFAGAIPECFNFGSYASVLDIAGASGIYVIAIKNKYNHLKAAVLEKSPVDRIALLSLRKRKMENEVQVIEGDMFNDKLPGNFDIHLYSHVLHDWNEEQNEILIRKSYESLNKGGLIMIHDAHLNEQKTGPLSVAEYSVLLMFSTYGKCYSFSELKNLLLKTGFRNIQYIPAAGNRSLITGEKSE